MKQSVLFVDDDVLSQWIMSDVLSTSGFSVTSVCRGSEAILMMNNSDEFDLLLTDLALPPGPSGFEVGAAWRLLFPKRPVIYTSATTNPVAGRLDVHEAFLRRPFEPSALLRLMDDLLPQHWISAHAAMWRPEALLH